MPRIHFEFVILSVDIVTFSEDIKINVDFFSRLSFFLNKRITFI
jgi:hypothetical protein